MSTEKFNREIQAGRIQVDEAHRQVHKVVTTAQVLALFATPQTIVPAPGANKALIFEGIVIHKPAGTAYGADNDCCMTLDKATHLTKRCTHATKGRTSGCTGFTRIGF